MLLLLFKVGLLGDGLIKSEGKGDGVLYSAVTVLPNVIELNYYASALLPVFALDAIVGRCKNISMPPYSIYQS